MRKILFYNDSRIFGGHEMMMLNIIQAWVTHFNDEIIVGYSRSNSRLHQEILKVKSTNASIQTVEVPPCKRLQNIRSFMYLLFPHRLKKVIKQINPDRIVAVQGTIEISSLVLVIARKLQIPAWSYIPVVHKHQFFRRGIMSRIKDMINLNLFKLPCGYMTLNSYTKTTIPLSTLKPSCLVRNFCESFPKNLSSTTSQRLRIGLLGRVEFFNKRQDFVFLSLCEDPDLAGQVDLKIIGDGPDLRRLQDICSSMATPLSVSFQPWQHEASKLYSDLDVVIIPSLAEGLPLTIIEAVGNGRKVLASDIPAHRELLPERLLFPCHSSSGLRQKIKMLQEECDPDFWKELREKYINTFSKENFIADLKNARNAVFSH